jgi:hypothetical protein
MIYTIRYLCKKMINCQEKKLCPKDNLIELFLFLRQRFYRKYYSNIMIKSNVDIFLDAYAHVFHLFFFRSLFMTIVLSFFSLLLQIRKVICMSFFSTFSFDCLLYFAVIYINTKLHNHEKFMTHDTER